MRVVCFVNNRVGYEIVRHLVARGEEIAALVVHPEHERRFGAETLAAASLPSERIFLATELRRPEAVDRLVALGPELGISAFFGYLLRPEVFERFPRGIVNLHPALLPYNRGSYPNVWSIVDGTPAGATLHYIDSGVDTGDIIAQQEVEVFPEDTGKTLYERLERSCLELFARTWPQVSEGRAPRLPQGSEQGTHHYKRDVNRIDEIDLDSRVRVGDLIDILRARTFPPYRGAYFVSRGERVFMRLELEREPGPHE